LSRFSQNYNLLNKVKLILLQNVDIFLIIQK